MSELNLEHETPQANAGPDARKSGPKRCSETQLVAERPAGPLRLWGLPAVLSIANIFCR